MNPFDALARFLKALLATDSGPPSQQSISLFEIDDWLSRQTASERTNLEQVTQQRFSEIRFVLSAISRQLAILESQSLSEESADPRIRKVVESSQQSFVDHMRQILHRLEPPRVTDFQKISDYSLSAYPMLQKEISGRYKTIAYTGVLLKKEIKSLGEHFSELERLLRENFDKFSQNQTINGAAKIRQKTSQIFGLQDETKKIATALAETAKQFSKTQAKRQLLLGQMESDQQSPQAIRKRELSDRLEQIRIDQKQTETDLIRVLESIDKPLRRLHHSVETRLAKNESVSMRKELVLHLSQLVKNLPAAFKSDPKGILFKEILVELRQAIESGAISLKADEKEKRIAAIYSLHEHNFFDSFFWKQNQSEVELQKLDHELKALLSVSQSPLLAAELSRLEDETKSLLAEKNRFEAQNQKNQSQLETAKTELEQLLATVSKTPVSIDWEEKNGKQK